MNIVKNAVNFYKKSPAKNTVLLVIFLIGLVVAWYVAIPFVITVYLWHRFKEYEVNQKGVKKCPHCKTEIDAGATRCPNCQGKMYVWTPGKKITAVILLFLVFIGFVKAGSSTTSSPATTVSPSPTPTTATDTSVKVGDTAFLRLPNTTDPTSVICLGSTKEEFGQVGKALLANDFIGLLEIPGAFCVSNGTKVQVLDQGYGVRRVRILEGVRKVDEDKVLRSGWTAMEWVVGK
ncbi:MAG TPA: hypothetical protein VJH06_00955 [Candidatus Paceibacterota bacterium]